VGVINPLRTACEPQQGAHSDPAGRKRKILMSEESGHPGCVHIAEVLRRHVSAEEAHAQCEHREGSFILAEASATLTWSAPGFGSLRIP